MSQFAVDESGHLLRENGSFVRVSDLEEIRQHVRVRHRLFRGEVPFDLSRGMRMLSYLLSKSSTPEMVSGEFMDSALGTPGVVSVDRISVDLEGSTRVGTIEYEATVDVDDARRRIPLHDTFTVSQRG